ncbi:MAG: hypothetical protein IKL90_05790 [Alphaproteobacteria bacterium]|nr:hypothetical protein [Alphaproteobacteria bacterium]
MKKVLMIAALVLAVSTLSGCMGERGRIGGQKVCTNQYLFGVLSVAEVFSPCGK